MVDNSSVFCLDGVFLNQACNGGKYVAKSHRLESSDALYYAPNLACSYTVTVDTGKKVMLISRIFELEAKVSGACVDYVNIHDGDSTAASTINTSPLCGVVYKTTYTSTDNAMTVYFETDSTGARHGFDFIFVAVTTGTCGTSQFACNNSVCIDSDLQCSQQDECADNSDEDGCDYAIPGKAGLDGSAFLIIGLCIGLFLFLLATALLSWYVYRHHIRWRLYLRRPLTVEEVVHEETTQTTAYPVTKIYYKEKFQDMYSDPGPPPYHSNYGSIKAKSDVTSESQGSSTDVISGGGVSTSTRKGSIFEIPDETAY
ncbi:LRP3-like protein [Mya arenaria]|uniref:LRP3-like protein n=1 Tax=Mya arenaria TaxID=6604 RepID=A0ABY7F1Y8_MYAAR|nr:LRP3-like protein [Mya arenaria]